MCKSEARARAREREKLNRTKAEKKDDKMAAAAATTVILIIYCEVEKLFVHDLSKTLG